MSIRAFAKVLSLATRICLPLVLRNNHSLNALNFGLTRDKNVGPKTMEYLSLSLNKQQQIKDSTLQNGILGQSTKNTDIFMSSFEWLKRNWRPWGCCLHSKFFYLSTLPTITSQLAVNFIWCVTRFDTICTI